MQLLDDDMDELFRNAASDYPLNTGGGDWDAMRNKLQQADNKQQGTATNKPKGRWWFKPWFLGIITAILLTVAVSGLFNGTRRDAGKGDIARYKEGQQSEGSSAITTGDDKTTTNSIATAEANNETNTSTGTNTPIADKTAATTVLNGKTESPDPELTEKNSAPANKPAQGNEHATLHSVKGKTGNTNVARESASADKTNTVVTGRKEASVQQGNTQQGIIQLTDRKQSATTNNNKAKGNKIVNDGDDHLNTNERVAATQKRQKVTTDIAGNEGRSVKGDSEQSIVNSENGNITPRASVTPDIPTSSYPAARSGVTAVSIPLSIERIHGTAGKYPSLVTNLVHTNKTVLFPDTPLVDIAKKNVKRESAFLKKGLYYGLVFSPDLTTVKMQRTSNVGYNIGLLAGYRFGKNLSVETGVLYERKYYYSTGQYFDKTKTPWPQDMDVLNVDGWCNMYEIPVNVRFTFATGKKSSWYVNGGMSSYIMKRQKYDYTYEYYGQPETRNWTYKKTMADWFSIIHLGVGYERPAGVLGILRVEPYVKIPARGVGIGDLPVTSVGVNIGLTRPLRLK